MEIKGKVKLFPELVERKNEEGKVEKHIICKASISSKTQEGLYNSKSISVRFGNERFPQSVIDRMNPEMCYTLEVGEGYLVVDSFTGKDGKKNNVFVLVVKEGRFSDPKKVERKEFIPVEDDLPF